MARSDTILGRKKNCRAFIEAKRDGGCFTVSAYRVTRSKRLRFTDPLAHPEPYPRAPSVVYLVRVTPKPIFI